MEICSLSNILQQFVLSQDLFSTMKQTYGVEIVNPTEQNVALYSRSVSYYLVCSYV